jgi:hypothetical protein
MNKLLTQSLDAALSDNIIARGLHAGSKMAERIDVNGDEIRPCIAILFEEGCTRGDSAPGRDPAGHLITVELRRLNIPIEEAIEYLRDWNLLNYPPLRESELQKIISSAYRRTEPYKYSCDHYKLSHTCIGKENCPWAKGTKPINNREIRYYFLAKGWNWVLKSNTKLIYLWVLPLLEGRRQVGTGGKVYVGYREIASILGHKYHSDIKRYLDELSKFGLIKFIPGDRLRSKRKASEISRILTIPDIPEMYLAKFPQNFRQ